MLGLDCANEGPASHDSGVLDLMAVRGWFCFACRK